MKRTPFKPRKTTIRRYSRLHAKNASNSGVGRLARVGKSDLSQAKVRIQKLLRDIVMKRDGGCVMRGYAETGACSGPLQAEHLIGRQHSLTFGDLRNIICLCQRHHIFYKPQNPLLYWKFVEKHIGPKTWAWVQLALADSKRPQKVDWKLVELSLKAHWETIRGVDSKEVMGSK